MQNASDLLKSGKKKDMAEYKETLEVMQQEMIELIQKSAKEFIGVYSLIIPPSSTNNANL